MNNAAPAIKGTPVISGEKVTGADVVIIGAGAAGLAAAVSACMNNPDANVIVVDRNEAPGKKIRATGNGRCNITNENAECAGEVIDFLREIGILVKTTGDAGLMYPRSESASDVAEALTDRALALGCRIMNESPVSEIVPGDKFLVKGRNSKGPYTLECRTLILACGGKAGPAYGTTGDGFRLAGSLGHEIVRPIPVLAPIECDNDSCEKIQGIRAKGSVTLYRNGERTFSEEGEVQFTKFGISGICVFNTTRHMRFDREEGISVFEIGVNLFPGEDILGELEGRVAAEVKLSANPKYKAPSSITILRTLVKDKLALYVFGRAGVNPGKPVTELRRSEITRIAEILADLRFHPTGVKGWKEAQCTSGGVKMSEIDQKTFRSLVRDNLYITGELMDYDGPCGGYNLNHAFLSGMRAGKDAVRGN